MITGFFDFSGKGGMADPALFWLAFEDLEASKDKECCPRTARVGVGFADVDAGSSESEVA